MDSKQLTFGITGMASVTASGNSSPAVLFSHLERSLVVSLRVVVQSLSTQCWSFLGLYLYFLAQSHFPDLTNPPQFPQSLPPQVGLVLGVLHDILDIGPRLLWVLYWV